MRISLLAVLLAFMPIAHATGLWGPQGFDRFCEQLPVANKAALAAASKEYLHILETRAHYDLSAIRAVRFEDIEPVLARATDRGMGTLDVFTETELGRRGACALFLDKAALGAIDRKYALRGIWQLAAHPAQNPLQDFRMDYLIVGQGHLVIGYPAEADVLVDDDSGDLRPYRYEPYISAEIINTGTKRGLFDVETLANPNGKFTPFEGPFGAAIHGFQIDGNDVVVKYTWLGDQDSRVSKSPIVRKDRHFAQK